MRAARIISAVITGTAIAAPAWRVGTAFALDAHLVFVTASIALATV